jgi:Flp pilus assembly protein TadD
MAEAEAHYRKALELNEIYEQSLANLSYMYLATERDDEALGLLAIGTKHYPGNAAFPTSMGVVLAKQGKFLEAREHFDKAVKLNPKKASIWINAGTVYYNLGDTEAAEKAYLRALELEPNDAVARQKLALTQLAKWGKAAKDNPNDLEVRRNYAMALLAAGHAGPAASETRNILEAYPEDHATRYAYAKS